MKTNEKKDVTFNYTGYGWEGKKYRKNDTLSATGINKLIRKELKEKFPECKFSVTKESYSGGQSITICLMSAPFKAFAKPSLEKANEFAGSRTTEEIMEMWKHTSKKQNSQLNQFYLEKDYSLSKKGLEVAKGMKKIANQYNFDDSDGMIDYFHTNFYLHLEIGKWDKPFELTK